MPVQLLEHAEGCGVALDPADVATEHALDRATLGETGRTDEDEEVRMSRPECAQVLLQPGVGGDVEGPIWASGAAFGGACRHGPFVDDRPKCSMDGLPVQRGSEIA